MLKFPSASELEYHTHPGGRANAHIKLSTWKGSIAVVLVALTTVAFVVWEIHLWEKYFSNIPEAYRNYL